MRKTHAHVEEIVGLRAFLRLVEVLSLASFFSFAHADNPFPVHESGYWTCESTSNPQCIYWLDDDRVIFSGTRPEDFETRDGRRIWKYAIYIWDLKTNGVAKYADASPRQFCYSDGYIRYLRLEGEKAAVIAGSLGKESVVNGQTANLEGSGWITNLSCGQYEPAPPYPLVGIKVALKKGHGFLFLGTRRNPESAKVNIQYFQDQAAKPLDLPLRRWQVNAFEIQSIDFRRAYLLSGGQIYNRSDRCVPEGFARQVHRMSLDGAVESIHLPARKELRCHVESRGISDVRSGLTVHINTGRLVSSYLYLVQGERVTTVARGRISQSAVSPNGCKLAIGLSSNEDPRKPASAEFYRGHLKVVDFCSTATGR